MRGSHFSAMQLEGMEKNVVLMDTISKRYSAVAAVPTPSLRNQGCWIFMKLPSQA
jgi:hypothetical protein